MNNQPDILNTLKAPLSRIIKHSGAGNPNLVFLVSLAFFLSDSIINYFVHIPVFVAYLMLLLPLLWLELWLNGRKNTLLVVFVLLFVFPFIINSFLYPFHRTNISDLVFILTLPTSYFYYKKHFSELKITRVHVFLTVVVLMFSFTFLDLNSVKVKRSAEIKRDYPITGARTVKEPKSELNYLESFRQYRRGLFRIPHIGAYFLGFLTLFYGFVYQRKRNLLYALIAFGMVVLMIYSGVRAFIGAALLALIIAFIRKKSLIYLSGIAVAVLLLLLFRVEIYLLTANTILRPFTATLITLVDNFEKISRFLIWRSWWVEFSQFELYQLLIGKSYFSSILANLANLHLGDWFHNDFLSIIYAYGIPAFGVYCFLFVRIYLDYAQQINGNFIIGVFFWCMPILAMLNGLYYYFPIVFMFVFLAMISNMKTA